MICSLVHYFICMAWCADDSSPGDSISLILSGIRVSCCTPSSCIGSILTCVWISHITHCLIDNLLSLRPVNTGTVYGISIEIAYTPFCLVEPPIVDTPKSGQPPYNRQTVCPLPTTACMLEPPKKGQPPNNGQNTRPQRVHCSEVPL